METNCTYLAYSETNQFSRIAIDYINGQKLLQPFYKHPPNIDGITAAIEERKKFPQQRQQLVEILRRQYDGMVIHSAVEENIRLLADPDTFTITTAHQPNIFTGPLYFIFKILHVIKITRELSKQISTYRFVPVYFMGSEDADLAELGTITVDGVPYSWHTAQTGAVGRMKVDKGLLSMIDVLQGQLGTLPFGSELLTLFKKAYTPGRQIQQATLELVNELFGQYGLVVIIPDDKGLKKMFEPVMEKELLEQFSSKIITETIHELERNYKSQASGRTINLFYLSDDKRERVELETDTDNQPVYTIHNTNIQFSKEEILKELHEHPDRFSPNVILRGVMQELILPNIAFIGGGGELAYWLELKKVFEIVNVPYPVLLLRNSFLIIEKEYVDLMARLNIQAADLFLPQNDLLKKIITERTGNKTKLNGELEKVEGLYNQIMSIASNVDITLKDHVASLKTKAVYRLQELEKKMLRAEKRKYQVELQQVFKIKEALFPGGHLQERVENISIYYGRYGRNLIKVLLDNSLTIEQQFAVLQILS